jgi:hypothetical protein
VSGGLKALLEQTTPESERLRRTRGYLTTAHVAARVGLEESSVRRLARAGLFPGARRTSPGRNAHWLIPPAAVEDFLRRTEVVPEDGYDEQDGQDGPRPRRAGGGCSS